MSRSLVDDTLRIRGGALIVSIAFHLAIFYALSEMETPSLRSFTPKPKGVVSPLRIQAQLIAPKIVNDIQPLPAADPVPAVDAVENSEVPVDVTTASPKVDAVVQPAIVETTDNLVSSDEPPVIDTSAKSWATPDSGPQEGAFGNVFNPRLRQRLQHNHTHRSTAKLGGLEETRDAYGDRRVALGNKRCMMAKQSMRSGEATDWYLTSCGGLDEGEKMLRRVEQNWRNRRE
jgi:hypothetical protein